jgi:hypothetical protein
MVRLMGPGGPAMVRSAMSKRFPSESLEAVEMIAPYLYQITAAPGSGEYALNLLLEPGAWARRPLCMRLLPLQGISHVTSLGLGIACVAVIMRVWQCPSRSYTAAEIGWTRSMRMTLCPSLLFLHR